MEPARASSCASHARDAHRQPERAIRHGACMSSYADARHAARPPPTPPCCWSTSARPTRRRRARCAATSPNSCTTIAWSQLPRWLWCPLLHFVILPLRAPQVAQQVRRDLDGRRLAAGGAHARSWPRRCSSGCRRCAWCTRCATASRRSARRCARCAPSGVQRVLVLPLYPQYSTTTTASVADVVDARPQRCRTRLVADYHLDAGWVAAVADSIRAHWQAHGRGDKLLFSFHGMPQRLVDAGDPYAAQCEASVRGDRAGARPGRRRLDADLPVALRPRALAAAVHHRRRCARWRARGVRRVDVVCPGFAVDCLETLEEIAMLNARGVPRRRRRSAALHPLPQRHARACRRAGGAGATRAGGMVMRRRRAAMQRIRRSTRRVRAA